MKKINYLSASILGVCISLFATFSYACCPGCAICYTNCKAVSNSATNTAFYCEKSHPTAKDKTITPMEINISLEQQAMLTKGGSYNLHDNIPHKILKIEKNKQGLVTKFEAESIPKKSQ